MTELSQSMPDLIAKSGDSSPFSEKDWADTRQPVNNFVLFLHKQNAELQNRVIEVEKRLNKNSSNSNKPPSSDNLFGGKPKKRKREHVPKKEEAYHENLC